MASAGVFFVRRSVSVAQAAHVPDDVLDHHDRAIHHHAEIERAQGKKIGRNVAQVEPDGGKEQRKWNRERDDERGAHIQQKQEQNDADQNHALGQVVHHRVQSEMQQVAAIEHGNDFHAGRQKAVVKFVDFLVNGVERGLLFRAFAHEHGALNHVGLVDDAPVLHVIRSRHVTQADFGPWVTSAMSLTRSAVPVLSL